MTGFLLDLVMGLSAFFAGYMLHDVLANRMTGEDFRRRPWWSVVCPHCSEQHIVARFETGDEGGLLVCRRCGKAIDLPPVGPRKEISSG